MNLLTRQQTKITYSSVASDVCTGRSLLKRMMTFKTLSHRTVSNATGCYHTASCSFNTLTSETLQFCKFYFSSPSSPFKNGSNISVALMNFNAFKFVWVKKTNKKLIVFPLVVERRWKRNGSGYFYPVTGTMFTCMDKWVSSGLLRVHIWQSPVASLPFLRTRCHPCGLTTVIPVRHPVGNAHVEQTHKSWANVQDWR